MLPTVYRIGARIATGKFPSQTKEEMMTISSNSLYETSLYGSYGSSTSSSTSSTSTDFAEALLTSMDSDSSGSIDSTEFSSAALALSNSDESTISSLFSSLDSDGDGTISEDELSSLFTTEESETVASGMPPPPPPTSSSSEEDTGYTAEELTAMAEESASTDTNLSSLLSAIAENFDAADTDGDGKVTSSEAMAYQQSSLETTDATETSTVSAAGGTPPPPPPSSSSTDEDEDDTGYTVDELTAMASETSSTDSALSALFETLAENFDAADTNEDGTVSASEARTYQDSAQATSSGTTTDTTEESTTSSEEMMKTLLAQIIANYASQNTLTGTSVSFSA